MKYKDLDIGDQFEVYGDIHLNYNFPKICRCIKISENTGREMEIGGINFWMSPDDEVELCSNKKECPHPKDFIQLVYGHNRTWRVCNKCGSTL
jgi:hypothetical protein